MEVLRILTEEEKWQAYLQQPRDCTVVIQGHATSMQCSFEPATCTLFLTPDARANGQRADNGMCTSVYGAQISGSVVCMPSMLWMLIADEGM